MQPLASVFSSALAKQAGINSHALASAVHRGDLERVAHGVYRRTDQPYDGYAVTHLIYPRGIFAKRSALVLYDLTDEIPGYYDMAFPHGYNPHSLTDRHVIPFRQSPSAYLLGVTHTHSPNGLEIPVYSLERTILDVWEDPQIEPAIRNEALRRYLSEYGNVHSRWQLADLQHALYPDSTLFATIGVLTP